MLPAAPQEGAPGFFKREESRGEKDCGFNATAGLDKDEGDNADARSWSSGLTVREEKGLTRGLNCQLFSASVLGIRDLLIS